MQIESGYSSPEGWAEIEALLGGAEALEALARKHGALKRARVVPNGSQLLRLILSYAVSGRSLRTTAAWSEPALGIELTDVAILDRLKGAGDFLAALVRQLLERIAQTVAPSTAWDGPPIRLVDGSIFSGPGPKGGQHRLHGSFDPVRQVFAALDVTAISKGESLLHLGIEPGTIGIADRNYARTHVLRHLDETGTFFVLRTGIRSVRLLDPALDGGRLTAQAVLEALGGKSKAELAVEMIEADASKKNLKKPIKARLVILRAGEEVAKREQARIKRSRSRHKATPTQETLDMAQVVMLITNLPLEDWPIDKIAALYKLRWQIELAFKTLKSLFEMRDPPAKLAKSARAWILANLVAALAAKLVADSLERTIPPSAQHKPQNP
jgi:Transposase DDE domain